LIIFAWLTAWTSSAFLIGATFVKKDYDS